MGKKSLTKNLIYSQSATIFFLIVISLMGTSLFFYNISNKKRKEFILTLGRTLSRLVARPISTGEFPLAEDYLQGKKLPLFIKSIKVFNNQKVLLAKKVNEKEGLSSCEYSRIERFHLKSNFLYGDMHSNGDHFLLLEYTDCDLKNESIKLGFFGIIIGCFLFLTLFYLTRKIISKSFKPLYDFVNMESSNLNPQIINELAPSEITPLLEEIINLNLKYTSAQIEIQKSQVADQVAHDIRSPLVALEMALSEARQLEDKTRISFYECIQTIRDIANNLSESKGLFKESDTVDRAFNLSSLIEKIVSRKRLEYKKFSDFKINFTLNSKNSKIFLSIDKSKFSRIISNIINNSFESFINSKGVVNITIEDDKKNCLISISDNGKGIPQDKQNKIFERGISHEKSGSGLGLSFATECVKFWSGELKLKSQVGIGTTILISIPTTNAPSWTVPEIILEEEMEVFIIDDDKNIHKMWKNRLSKYERKLGKIYHFHDPISFKSFFEKFNHRNSLILSDYEFVKKSDKINGLELIKSIMNASKFILVTGHSDETHIIDECESMKINLLPKNLIPITPLKFQKTKKIVDSKINGIYIDDSKILRKQIQDFSNNRKLSLMIFESPTKFLEKHNHIPKHIPIFIDLEFPNDSLNGDLLAEKLFHRGFRNLILCTGHDIQDFNLPCFKHIINKENLTKSIIKELRI